MVIVSRLIHVKVGWQLNVTNKLKNQRWFSSRLATVLFRWTPCIFLYEYWLYCLVSWDTLYLYTWMNTEYSVLFLGISCIFIYEYWIYCLVSWDTLYLYIWILNIVSCFLGHSVSLNKNTEYTVLFRGTPCIFIHEYWIYCLVSWDTLYPYIWIPNILSCFVEHPVSLYMNTKYIVLFRGTPCIFIYEYWIDGPLLWIDPKTSTQLL